MNEKYEKIDRDLWPEQARNTLNISGVVPREPSPVRVKPLIVFRTRVEMPTPKPAFWYVAICVATGLRTGDEDASAEPRYMLCEFDKYMDVAHPQPGWSAMYLAELRNLPANPRDALDDSFGKTA